MQTQELLKKVRKIEIRTRGISRHLFSGSYHSAFKGRGIAFSEVREYIPGDEIRLIDWNVTARFNHPYIKIFEEERELTVMMLIDISGSENFGTSANFKRELITEISAVLAFSAIHNNDKVGVIFFSDKIEKFIPPKKGKTHILRIIRELIDFQPESNGTDIANAVQFFSKVIKKRSIAFVISDFLSKDFEEPLKIVNKRHDIVAIQIYDQKEEELPDLGLIKLKDPESGNEQWVDSSSGSIRKEYRKWWLGHQSYLENIFRKSRIDNIKIRTDLSYIAPLMNFFKMRGSRR